MAFHRKYPRLLELAPDIAAIQEVADMPILERTAPDFKPGGAIWVGNNPMKGSALFAFNGLKLTMHESYDSNLRYLLPVEVHGRARFNVLVVWSFNNVTNSAGEMIRNPVAQWMDKNPGFAAEAPTIVLGDFNNHVKWDRGDKQSNFANTISSLDLRGLESAYHCYHGVAHGCEMHTTHYWRDRKRDSPFNCHIDYAFIPKIWKSRLGNLEVGSFDAWCGCGLSDHVPLSFELTTA